METLKFTDLKIQVTDDPSIFKQLEGNRKANNANVKRIKLSVKNNGQLFSPILVNQDYQILDGQNRVQAFTEMGLKIPYIMLDGYGLKEIQTYNNFQNNWNDDNYMDCYVDLDASEYIKYKEYKVRFKFTHPVNWSLLTDDWRTNHKTMFRDGKFKIIDRDKADKIAACIHEFNFYTHFSKKAFIQAIVEIMDNVPGYIHSKMVYSLQARVTDLNGKAKNVPEYKKALQEIYNIGMSMKKRLVFYSPLEFEGLKVDQSEEDSEDQVDENQVEMELDQS